MSQIDTVDSCWRFFWWFFKTKRGQILALATPAEDVRDGLALTQIARLFPLPDFEGIVVEPSRPTIQRLEENLILVGSASLFFDPAAHQISGAPPLSIGDEKLRQRLLRIHAQSCYRFIDGEPRALLNTVTGQKYVPTRDAQSDLEVDFAVIRRVFRGPSENTISLEGLHRLGTLGATKVATNRVYLDAIWAAVKKLDDFDEAQPLEILVQATFKPKRNQVYAFENITAVPLAIAYSRDSAYDLIEGQCWRDQRPWDITLLIEEKARPRTVVQPERDPPVPRLEIQADLRGLDAATRRLCRDVAAGFMGNAVPTGNGAAEHAKKASRLFNRLAARPELFRIELVHPGAWATNVRTTALPDKGNTPIRRTRKHFFAHLALARVLGQRFRCDDRSVRRFFPSFTPRKSARPFVSQFIGSVPGKMRDGFRPLLGDAGHDREYVEIEYDRVDKTYQLRLNRAVLMLRFRV